MANIEFSDFLGLMRARTELGKVVSTLDIFEMCLNEGVDASSLLNNFGMPGIELMVIVAKTRLEEELAYDIVDLRNIGTVESVLGIKVAPEFKRFLDRVVDEYKPETMQEMFELLVDDEDTLCFKMINSLINGVNIEGIEGLGTEEDEDYGEEESEDTPVEEARRLEIVGREAELGMIGVLADKTYNNNIIIIGRPGIGKKSVVDKFMENSNGKVGVIDLALEKGREMDPMRISMKVKKLVSEGKTMVYVKNVELALRPHSDDDRWNIATDLLKMARKADGAIICVFDSASLKHNEYNMVGIKPIEPMRMIDIMGNKLQELIRGRNVDIDGVEWVRFNEKYYNGNLSQLIDYADTLVSLAINTNKGVLDANTVKNFEKLLGKETKNEELKDMEILKNLRNKVSERIIGQNEAVEKVVKAIRRNKSGVRIGNKPIGTFLFVGPTGVGKTELVKVLDKELNENKSSIIRFDMSEFSEGHSVSKLIGSPPGYVGHDDGGQLTKKIKENPSSIVLFDEIEKAHDNVYNMMLQLMDDGRLTDSKGETVDFRRAIIVMTSNAGYGIEESGKKSIGFSTVETDENHMDNDVVLKALEKTFKPEFLNRIDSVVKFNRLAYEEILKITKLLVDDVISNIRRQGYKIEVEEELYVFVAKGGFSDRYGARNIKRAIQDSIEDFLADEIIEGRLEMDREYNLGVTEGKVSFVGEQAVGSFN